MAKFEKRLKKPFLTAEWRWLAMLNYEVPPAILKPWLPRGVVFVRELVPKPMIAAVARVVYDEPYLAVHMHHEIEPGHGTPNLVEYRWTFRGEPCHLRVKPQGDLRPLRAGEEAEFITEHYWGHAKRSNGQTSEYEVAHPRWCVMETCDSSFSAPVKELYGAGFQEILAVEPVSALLAEGSEIAVYQGASLP